MHGWIEYSMNIPLFSFLMASSYICFYDGEEIAAWAKRLGRRFRRASVTVLYPAGSELEPAASAFLAAVDPFDLVAYEPSEGAKWAARRADGSATGPVFASWSRSLGAWIIGVIPGLWRRLLERSVAPLPAREEAPAAVHR
jgi:hypothetical protein